VLVPGNIFSPARTNAPAYFDESSVRKTRRFMKMTPGAVDPSKDQRLVANFSGLTPIDSDDTEMMMPITNFYGFDSLV
jgi:hypothetical protein